MFGRKTSADDPDKGLTELGYDSLDRLTKTTDSFGRTVLSGYDTIGRVTGTWTGSKTDANQLTALTYDSLLKGLPDASTRYVGGKTGKAYTRTVTAYDSLSRPTATELSLPASDPLVEAGAPATLAFENRYNIDGTLQSSKEPAVGGLPSEIVDYGYTGLGQVTSIGGSTGYLLDVDYSALGQAQQLVLGTANTEEHKKAYVTNTWEEGTGRLLGSHVTDQTHPYKLQALGYTYDQAGNITSIADTSTLGGTASAETQCFAYDGHRRLTEAWTPASQKCSEPRSATALGGRSAYWTSYSYNDAGQRTTETKHTSTSNTTTTYCYEKTDQPHTLTGTSTEADCADPDRSYEFDSTGNTTSRPDGAAPQDLDWSDEGRLATLTEGGKTTDYLYGPDGTLLIRATESGERVLYLGSTELHLRANGSTWAQRHYSAGSLTVAVRSNESGSNELSYLVTDHHGTATLAIDATNQEYSRRYTTPFGAPRGTTTGAAWPDDKGFLGKTTDTGTGLTHVDARQYDPDIGQFISIDPLLSLDQIHSLNGYSYANQNPATESDPTGLESCYGVAYCSGSNGTYGTYKPKKKTTTSSGDGPTRACRCGTRPPLVKGMKPTGLGGIPGRRNITLPSAPAPKGWLKTTPPPPNPGPKPKKEGFLAALKTGWNSVTGNTSKIWDAYFAGDTTGICISGSAGIGAGVTASVCLVNTTRPDGKTDYGVRFRKGSETPSVGANVGIGLMGSNATDFEQLRGDGWGGTVTGAFGVAVSGSHERAIGAENSRGEAVGSTTIGLGAGLGVEGGFTTSHNTRVGKLFTVDWR